MSKSSLYNFIGGLIELNLYLRIFKVSMFKVEMAI